MNDPLDGWRSNARPALPPPAFTEAPTARQRPALNLRTCAHGHGYAVMCVRCSTPPKAPRGVWCGG